MKMSGKRGKNPDGVIVFSGFNQRSVISLCRTLEACRIQYFIIAHSATDAIFRSTYAARVSAVRSNPTLNIDDLCNCISTSRAGNQSRFVIAPSSEALNLFLLAHRERVEAEGDILPLVEETLYRMISDKASFGDRCRESDILVPPEMPATGRMTLPAVAKPYCGTLPDGRRIDPLLFYTEQEWNQFASSPDRLFYFVQRYIRGPSYYLQYYFYASGRVDRFSMRNIVQQPGGKSIVAAEPACLDCEEVCNKFEGLFQALGFRGLVMVEVMVEDGRYYMIEANPRMWGPAQLMLDAGCNLYISLVNDMFDTRWPLNTCSQRENPLYFWWAGFWGPQLQGKPMKWHCPPEYFWARYPDLMKAEIYCRDDTRGMFLQEASELPVPFRN